MLRRPILITVFALMCFSVDGIGADEPSRPNIVLILADDLGWTDLSCYGSLYYETPNIDRLAAAGIRFTNAYSNGPNCTPSRAGLLSGQYPARYGIYTARDWGNIDLSNRSLIPAVNQNSLPSGVVTLAERLKTAGYRTAHIGKWRVGTAPGTGPLAEGFDASVGREGPPGSYSYFSPYGLDSLDDGPEGEYLTDRLTDEAIDVIRGSKGEPFFLYMAHYAVHIPLHPRPDPTQKYRDKPKAGGHNNPKYALTIANMDESVGRIVDELEALNLTDNTIVIFASDNGGLGGFVRQKLKVRDITTNAPLRGGKGMLYEGGIRVPTIIKWPTMMPAGKISDTPIMGMDFYPTLMEIAALPLGPGDELDSLSLLAHLKSGGEEKLEREDLFWHFPGYLPANMKHGTWKATPVGVVRRGDHKLLEFFEDDRAELYNLANDIGETENLADLEPERVSELREALAQWRVKVNATMPTRKASR